jgi:UDP-glucose 4-epimerase
MKNHDKMKQKILITGGAGFIGSHVNKMLHEHEFDTVVIDNLTSGNRNAVVQGTFVQGDIGDSSLLEKIFTENHIAAVMHFAALTEVGESIEQPLKYYENNVSATITLLEAMKKNNVNNMIFSSTAAIFGNPQADFITEEHPQHPINPYGQTKLVVEKVLSECERAYGLRFCSFRYFNAAGGAIDGVLKNYKEKEANLIPIILKSLKYGNNSVTIFGTDYPTSDGTCIRDYIHVYDLGTAHILALKKLLDGTPTSSCFFNLGNGKGYSVREVISAVATQLFC